MFSLARENLKSGIEIRTRPDLKFLNWKIEIRTCPKLKSGHVRIWNFSLINENPDTSGFEIFQENMEIRTRPDLYFSIDKYQSRLTKFVTSSSPDFNFSIGKWKSGHVQIYIFPLININPDWQNSLCHLVRILIFSIGKWKSGHVWIYILPLININTDWQNSGPN